MRSEARTESTYDTSLQASCSGLRLGPLTLVSTGEAELVRLRAELLQTIIVPNSERECDFPEWKQALEKFSQHFLRG